MGQFLLGGARTTEAVRRATQYSQESLRALSERQGLIKRPWPNGKSVLPWLIFQRARRSQNQRFWSSDYRAREREQLTAG
jgi:hypothetical protein